MRFRTQLFIGVTVLLLVASGATSARLLRLSNQTFRITSGQGEREGFIICPLTLEGSFHERTLAKTIGSLIGYITRASLNEGLCTGGGATYLRETLPWHVRYAGFAGALPNVTAITTQIIGLSFIQRQPEIFEVRCLYRTSSTNPGVGIWSRDSVTKEINRFEFGGREEIPSGTCSGFKTNLIGTTPIVTVLSSTSKITLTLI